MYTHTFPIDLTLNIIAIKLILIFRSKNRKTKHSNVMKIMDDSSGPDFALPPPSKMHRNSHHRNVDSNSSDHVVVITELKEQIAMIQKQSSQKDFQLLNKDKFVRKFFS